MVNSAKIKARAKETGIRQIDIAKLWGVKQPTANQKINNVRPMSLREAEILASVLEIGDEDFRIYFFSGGVTSATTRRGGEDVSIYTPILQRNPNAKPLARALIAAAAEQGASPEEFRIACDLAIQVFQAAAADSITTVSLLKGKAEAALERF